MRRGTIVVELAVLLAVAQFVALLLAVRVVLGPLAAWERASAEAAAQPAGLLPSDDEQPKPAVGYDAATELIVISGLLHEEATAWQAVGLAERDGGLPHWEPTDGPLPGHHRRVYEKSVASQRTALRVLDQVADRYDPVTRQHWPGGDWFVLQPTGASMPYDALLPWLNAQRSLGQAMQLRSLLAFDDGRTVDALRDARIVLGQADAMANSDSIVALLVGLGSRNDAVEAIEHVAMLIDPDHIDDASAEAVRSTIVALLDDTFVERSLLNGVRGETRMMVASIDSFWSNAIAEHEAPAEPVLPAWGRSFAKWSIDFLVRPLVDREVSWLLRYMLEINDAVPADNAPEWLAAVPSDEELDVDPSWTRPIALGTILIASWDRAGRVHFDRLAAQRRAATGLAIRLDQADHNGTPPATLEELVPNYLPSVPRDPTATDEPIGYDADRLLLWTAGEDLDHDGGVSEDDLLAAEPNATARELTGRFDDVLKLR